MDEPLYFYLARLIDSNGDRLASEEIWVQDPKAPESTPERVALDACGFFACDEHGALDPAGCTVQLVGPFFAGEPSHTFNIEADSPAEAVEKARADWRQSIDADEDEEPAEVVKVYRGTLSERVFDYDAPQDLSGGDPGYTLVRSDGPVILTLETATGIEKKAAFACISDAEAYISISTTIDPIDREAGRYGIDAPHGMGGDIDAIATARALGFDVFYSREASYYTKGPRGDDRTAWTGPFVNQAHAALAALATVEP